MSAFCHILENGSRRHTVVVRCCPVQTIRIYGAEVEGLADEPAGLAGYLTLRSILIPTRKWRNWQTHQLEGLALARAWGFESPLPHQMQSPLEIRAFS